MIAAMSAASSSRFSGIRHAHVAGGAGGRGMGGLGGGHLFVFSFT